MGGCRPCTIWKGDFMEKRALVLALALTLPLALYGIPYSYAATKTSTYGVIADYSVPLNTSGQFYAFCSSGDFATGGGYATFRTVTYSEAYPRPPPTPGPAPNGWAVTVAGGAGQFGTDLEVEVVCMTPITVAGIGVPQFGSLYMAIALGAVAYFLLARRYATGKTKGLISIAEFGGVTSWKDALLF